MPVYVGIMTEKSNKNTRAGVLRLTVRARPFTPLLVGRSGAVRICHESIIVQTMVQIIENSNKRDIQTSYELITLIVSDYMLRFTGLIFCSRVCLPTAARIVTVYV
jgi:hypothetical protein